MSQAEQGDQVEGGANPKVVLKRPVGAVVDEQTAQTRTRTTKQGTHNKTKKIPKTRDTDVHLHVLKKRAHSRAYHSTLQNALKAEPRTRSRHSCFAPVHFICSSMNITQKLYPIFTNQKWAPAKQLSSSSSVESCLVNLNST